MLVFIIIVAIVVFLWWSLVPAKPKEPNLTDIINQSQKRQGKMSNVYRHNFLNIYYSAESTMNPDDKKVFTGTQAECESYVFKHSKHRF